MTMKLKYHLVLLVIPHNSQSLFILNTQGVYERMRSLRYPKSPSGGTLTNFKLIIQYSSCLTVFCANGHIIILLNRQITTPWPNPYA